MIDIEEFDDLTKNGLMREEEKELIDIEEFDDVTKTGLMREEKVELVDIEEFDDVTKIGLMRKEGEELIEDCKELTDDTGDEKEIQKQGRKRKGRHRRRRKNLKRFSIPILDIKKKINQVFNPKYVSHPDHDPNKWILMENDMRHHFPSYFLNHD